MPRQKVTPFLWFDDQAEEAALFYVSLFPNSRITSVTPGPAGRAMIVEFELDGSPLIALNGGPQFPFTEAISLSIDCADQTEIDWFWDRLSDDGIPSRCGWLKDRYGLWWQVVPAALPELLSDAGRRGRVMAALMQMDKLDIAQLEAACHG